MNKSTKQTGALAYSFALHQRQIGRSLPLLCHWSAKFQGHVPNAWVLLSLRTSPALQGEGLLQTLQDLQAPVPVEETHRCVSK